MVLEVLEGQIYDLFVDIFSFVIIMWEMWYGRSVVSSCEYCDLVIFYNCFKVSIKKKFDKNSLNVVC